MRTFSCTTIQDGSSLPWCYELPPIQTAIPVWGHNIIPAPQYESYIINEGGFTIGVGDPIAYTWPALLDPADTPLPEWITEITPADSLADIKC
jgi:hypothetical protein